MPYSSVGDLPEAVKRLYSSRCQDVFRRAFNDSFRRNADERVAFQDAHAAAKNCQASTR